MGDRCDVTIIARVGDMEAMKEKWQAEYEEDSEVASEVVEQTFAEVNYGGESDLRGWSSEGRLFYGWHTAGGDYGPFVFVSDGKEYIETPAWDGSPTVTVSLTGEANEDDFQKCREYLWLLAHVKNEFGITD
jgi:hypothetical protein